MSDIEPEGGGIDLFDLDAARELNDENELKEHLLEIRRISRVALDLKKAMERHTLACVPLIKQLGTRVIEDPVTGAPLVASVIEAETLVVDAGKLLEALQEQCDGDLADAESIWLDVLKPAAVDTKEEGLFALAVDAKRITLETVAKVASYKKSKGYVSFGKPGQ